MTKLLFILLSTTLLSACESYQPPAPDGPDGSWWVGGVDGGVYVFIEDDDNLGDNIYQGSIYFESDQSIWYRGKFRYSKNTPVDYKNRALYSGWDGENLYLKDNSYLAAIEPVPSL